MAKYKAYPEYKDSGVESLDTIPKMWSIKKLKYIFEIKKRIAGKIGFDVLSVTQKGIKIKDIESGEGQLSMDYSKYQRVYPGEFAMNHMDLLTGYVDISNYDGVTSPDYRVFAVRDKHSFYSRYYLYLLQDGYKQRRFFHLGQGSAHLGRWRLPTEAFNEIVYPCPSLKEQIHIASFLDHETARIDDLIEKQQQLIELLKEKRQAVISHAVTKGLNPDVPMKDSGVEWLGEVPAHWEVIKIKYLTEVFEQGWSPQCEARRAEKNEYGVLKVGCVNSGKFDSLENKALPLTLEPKIQYLIKKDDLLISRANTRELVGRSAVAEEDYDNLIICDKLYRLKLKPIASPYLISEFLGTSLARQQIELAASGASHSMQNIGQDTINEMAIALPPQNETQYLLRYISAQVDKFATLSELSHRQISVLQERRTALISAAVTGKIDVRDWVAPDTQKTEETAA